MQARRALILLALLLAGCGGGYAPVSGRVTLDGQPAQGVRVSFVPVFDSTTESASNSSGLTDAEGRYTLRAINPPGNGAVAGKHRVFLTKLGTSAPGAPPPELLPERYNTASELEFQVPAGGTSAANFGLQSK
jgi:hypothetical protein